MFNILVNFRDIEYLEKIIMGIFPSLYTRGFENTFLFCMQNTMQNCASTQSDTCLLCHALKISTAELKIRKISNIQANL